jgi:hypothetical protein
MQGTELTRLKWHHGKRCAAQLQQPTLPCMLLCCSPVTYTQGQVITLRVGINAPHGGKFQFSVCPRTSGFTQDCFNQPAHYLTRWGQLDVLTNCPCHLPACLLAQFLSCVPFLQVLAGQLQSASTSSCVSCLFAPFAAAGDPTPSINPPCFFRVTDTTTTVLVHPTGWRTARASSGFRMAPAPTR